MTSVAAALFMGRNAAGARHAFPVCFDSLQDTAHVMSKVDKLLGEVRAAGGAGGPLCFAAACGVGFDARQARRQLLDPASSHN